MTSIQRTCRDCGSQFETSNRSTRCNACGYQRARARGSSCDCGAVKDPRSTHCRKCSVLSPEGLSRVVAGLKRPPKTAEQWAALALATAERRGDCLLATAWTPQAKGYIRVAGKTLHRLVVEADLGRPLLVDESVDHQCHNRDASCEGGPTCWHRRCINIKHLEVTDPVTNWRRGRHGGPRRRSTL